MFSDKFTTKQDALIDQLMRDNKASKLDRWRHEFTAVISMLANPSGWVPTSTITDKGIKIPSDAIVIVRSESNFQKWFDIRGGVYLKPISSSESVKLLPTSTLETVRSILALDAATLAQLGLPHSEETSTPGKGVTLKEIRLRIQE